MAANRCAACKFFNMDCDANCVFAPHFPSTEPTKFECVDRIFGAGNIHNYVSRFELPSEREHVVSSMVYAAEARIRDPIFGIHGMFLQHKKELDTLKEKINSAKNELATIVGPDKVPPYYDLPIPDIVFSTSFSLPSIIEKIERLTEIQKNQLMQLPPADAQKIMNEMFGKREDQAMHDGHGAASTSTSNGPSMP